MKALPGRPQALGAAVALLVLTSLSLNVILLARTGVRLGGDSIRYTTGANLLLTGRPLVGFDWTYASYVATVAAVQGLGGDLRAVVGVHLVAAALTGAALWSLGATLGGPLAGLAAAAVLLVNPDILRWHAYILSDSLYISTVTVAAWAVWRAAQRGGSWYAAALGVLAFGAFLRPTGVVLLPVAGAFWAARGLASRSGPRVVVGVATVIGAVMLVVAIPAVRPVYQRVPARLLERGDVFYNDPASRIAMPAWSAADQYGWLGALRYAARHPGPSLRLVGRRLMTELGHVRPSYSAHHNALIIATLVPLYALAIAGAAATWRHPLAHWLLTLIVVHLGLVAITLADRDGRFLLHVLGPIGVLAGAGLSALVRRRLPTAWTEPRRSPLSSGGRAGR